MSNAPSPQESPAPVGESRRLEVALAILMTIVGIASWSVLLQPELEIDASPLATLPFEIGGYQGTDIDLEDGVAEMLRADLNLQRGYEDESGIPTWLYIGYYGTERGGRPEHTPEVCYPSAGWTLLAQRTIELDPEAAPGLYATELLVEYEGHQRFVHYWYRSYHSKAFVNGFGSIRDQITNRLWNGRGDGALVRVSTPTRGDQDEESRDRLRNFAVSLDALLANHWPIEQEKT